MTANFLIVSDLFLQLVMALCLTGATSALHSVELRIIKNSVTLCRLQENAYFTSHYLLLNYYIFLFNKRNTDFLILWVEVFLVCKDVHVFANLQDCQGKMAQKATKELGFLGSKAHQDLQVRDGSAMQIQFMLITSQKMWFRKNIYIIWKNLVFTHLNYCICFMANACL